MIYTYIYKHMKTPDMNDHRLESLYREALTPEPTAAETERAWQAFAAKHRRQHTRRTAYLAVASVAAVLAVVLVLRATMLHEVTEGIQVFASLDSPSELVFIEKDGRTTAYTPAGTTATFWLGDSTEVLLSANSRLEYPTQFMGEVREVNLSGEARFRVTKHEGAPFIVHTAALQTCVFGTVFDVRVYPQGTPDVALYEGSIGVTYQGKDQLMKPGEEAFVDADGTLQIAAAAPHRDSWAEGYFTYDDQDLRAVMQEIGAWYNLTVTFQSPHLLEERIHFRFSRQRPVGTILQVLNDMGIAQFALEDEGIVVR